MFVCLYVCMPVCVHICMLVCWYVCMLVCLYACMFVRLYVCMFVCLHACVITNTICIISCPCDSIKNKNRAPFYGCLNLCGFGLVCACPSKSLILMNSRGVVLPSGQCHGQPHGQLTLWATATSRTTSYATSLANMRGFGWYRFLYLFF